MKSIDAALHVRGESLFVGDMPELDGQLVAAVYTSPIAHGTITSLNFKKAEQLTGIHSILTAADIPGKNQIGTIIQDEPLLAQGEVHFIGQPVALVVGESLSMVKKAVKLVDGQFEPLPAIFDAREAFAKGQLIAPSRTFSLGQVDKAWQECAVIVEGQATSGGQEHLYLETQIAVAHPVEDNAVKIYSATQAAFLVQKTAAALLGISIHKVEVEAPRLGGAFGGKEDQATAWACLAALAAFHSQRPVKMSLQRSEDMAFTGKRHPYSSDYKIGLDSDGTILAYEVMFYQNAGAAADLSTAILERTLFHTTNSYYIPNVKASAVACKTNLPPNTAFRGFGAPQAMFVLESAIYHAADKMGIEPADIQQKNLLQEFDEFPYGMKAKNCHAQKCWQQLDKHFNVPRHRKEVKTFNEKNRRFKKGLAIMPISFGISFTNTGLNQASALVHVFPDGSVSISTGAVEMGQGVKAKIQSIAARIFSIRTDRIKIEFTNTQRIANMSPTAASTGADMNGHATRIACETILARLAKFAEKQIGARNISFKNERVYADDVDTGLSWPMLLEKAYWQRINLSAHAFYATPNIYFDKATEKGEPFSYHVYGAALVKATVDCLLGRYTIDAVKVVHDAGKSLHPKIDLGQIEGGIVQGLGWMTMEEVLHDQKGKLVTDTLTTYKVPDIHFTPDIAVEFLKESDNSGGPFNSKAIGEPPFMYGIAGYFAILNAMKEFNPDAANIFDAPLTPEKVLLALHPDFATSKKR